MNRAESEEEIISGINEYDNLTDYKLMWRLIMDKITVLNSKLFSGIEFNKDTLGSTYKAKNRFKMLLTEKYPLSEDFKSKKEFKEILRVLG